MADKMVRKTGEAPTDGVRRSVGGRPRKDPREKLATQIALRLDVRLVERLDAHVARLQKNQPAATWTRGSAIRDLMITALDRAESQA